MKHFSEKLSYDLELAGALAALIVIALTVATFFDYKEGAEIITVALAMGTILNGILAGAGYARKHLLSVTGFGMAALICLIFCILTAVKTAGIFCLIGN